MKGILVIGPREWGNDHQQRLEEKSSTAMQYTARNLKDAQQRLSLLAKPFPLFVYVPKKYHGTPNGSQTIEFACRVVDCQVSSTVIASPWPTIKGPQPYDEHDNFKYEFWFKVDLIQRCTIPVTEFVYHKMDGSEAIYDTVAKFIGPARRKIMFVSSKVEYPRLSSNY